MAYDPNPNVGPVRDKAYPSQIAAERPMLATRIHCVQPPDFDATIHHDNESPSDRFNRQLREE